MKKKLLIISFVLVAGGFIYFFFNGNPISRSEANKLANDYLEKRYPDYEFILTNGGYYPGEGTYIINFQSENKEVNGNLDIRKGKVRHEEKGDAL
ncbi:hypothetical protein DYI25_04140 [Mesobacillus boroniphilus]|uniref:YfjL-like N-terminal domain-containing protein n=1 Tax=Mesobacillus boroniphilus TaxID=308892 RepID=A0A944GVK2_9BACI|nr:hypothetical protein [Mesobacillus boroniphilus]MBS8263632.1 hypothetical protein [Mesobacillus boroniphilus]